MPGSLCDVIPAAAALLGAGALRGAGEDRLTLRERLGPRRTVVIVLVDGLGLHLLPVLAPHAPLLADALAGRAALLEELACGFPSTTPSSLVSLGTGVLPGEHGILGFTLRVPPTDDLLVHVRWQDDPDPEVWQPVPTWFQRMAGAGIDVRAVLPQRFLGGGLTRAAYRGARMLGVAEDADYARTLAAQVHGGPGVVYGYVADLDTATHVHGIGSPEWFAAAGRVDALLGRLSDELPADAVLLVTADHGALNVPPDARIDLDADERLRAGLTVVAGEPRVRYLHTVDGAALDVAATWRAIVGDTALVLTRAEAIEGNLFGPVPDRHVARIGDVVVICTGDGAIVASAHEPPEIAELIGFHGGMRPEETAIPLIAWAG